MSTNPSLTAVHRQAINWRHMIEVVLLVALTVILAVMIIGLLLAIGADQIEVG
jgi:ABC-type uncharacterized transport system permease subunit